MDGYTQDSGRIFTKKYITTNNVNFNGYSVNLTFGFGISGVKAFDANTIIVYGDYGLVPSVLYSTDGGNTFTLIYNSQFNNLQLSTGITDMIFPRNDNVGYACDADRVLKTTDKGLTWSVVDIDAGRFFDHLEAPDDATIFAMSTAYATNKLVKSTNGGAAWQPVTLPYLPDGKLVSTYFLDANTGWLDMSNDNDYYFYKTSDGGSTWLLLNNIDANPFYCKRMKFIDGNVGFAISDQYTVSRTSNGGVNWEPLPRDNNYAYLNYSHNDLQCLSPNQLWAGGGHGFLEMSTNSGGIPLPKSYFRIDTTGLYNTGTISLLNYSATGYSYKWVLDGTAISTSYNASYVHDVNRTADTLALIVSNGAISDTATKYQYFYPPVIVSGFMPTSAGAGTSVTITGINFSGATSVSFGGTEAASFTVAGDTTITAVVGKGTSGAFKVITPKGRGSLKGFTFLPPPTIASFTPMSATAGTRVTITGTNFTGVTDVRFAGIAATGYTVVSPTTITVIVPSGGSGDVAVTTTGGVDSLSGFISLPTISSFSPLHGTQGTILHISGTSFTGGTAVTIGGINALSFTVNSSTDITAIVGTGASGNVTVTKAGGNSSVASFTWFTNPVITSFSPASGAVGTLVTITGTGFDPATTKNTVYFGAVKAVVTGGNANSLTVIVPMGATFEPISVTANNLIGYSTNPFLVTFPNGGSITNTSFTPDVIDAGATIHPINIAVGDVDGDGRPDLIVSAYQDNALNNGVLLYRNTSTVSTISFADPILFGNLDFGAAALGDLDGDGKLDLIIVNGGYIMTYRNTSVPGTISFVPGVTLTTANGASGISISDVDGDGKADIVVPGAVFRNTSEPGNISFATRFDFTSASGRNILVTDIDGDHKPDLVIPDGSNNAFYVLQNNSTKGNLSFGTPIGFPGYLHSFVAAADIDGDGKTDIVSGDNDGSKVAIIINMSTPGNITFAPANELNATSTPAGVAVSDLDGDGQIDIAACLINNNLGLFKNATAGGILSFSPKVDYLPGYFPGNEMTAIVDINGDGKNDVIVTSETQHSITVYVNTVRPEPFVRAFTPALGGAGTSVTITGNNFTGTSGVSFGGVPAASFTVNSPTSITAILDTGASGDVAVTNNYGTGIRPGYVFGNPPRITSIAPTLGPVGAPVTINGNNFNPVSHNNIVYFGGVRAVVISATANTIVVTVPAGAAHAPVTVTVDNLTAYSTQLFDITFSGGSSSFGATSFAPRIDRSGGGRGVFTDMDGDGKPDLVTGWGTSGVVIARNTSTPGTITFDPDLIFSAGGADILGVATGDLDGDGKPDVAAYSYNSSSISVGLNNSTAGTISLATMVNYPTGPSTTRPLDVTINDIDGDGKPDIVVANYYSQTISVFKNLSTPGNLILDTRVDYHLDGYPTGVTLRDIDGDGKPDMIASANAAIIFLNTSVPGTISFAPRVSFPLGDGPDGVNVGDMDGDGKLDLVAPNIGGNTISFLRNLSTPGNIMMAPKQDFTSGAGPSAVSIGDLDGDGKPDIAEENNYSDNTVSVFKNISATGTIAMQPKFNYGLGGTPNSGSIQDIDGDGRADIVVNVLGGTTSFFRNRGGDTVILRICANTDTSIASGLNGPTYQWQQDAGAGFTNITNSTNFSGVNTSTLGLTDIPASWDLYNYRCTTDGAQISVITTLRITAVVIPSVTATASSNSICQGTGVTFTAAGTNAGSHPVWQWEKNGVVLGITDTSYTSSTLTNGDAISVQLTSNASCASPVTVRSNTITMSVRDIVIPSISINGSTTINQGASTTIMSAITSGGSAPVYQWQDSIHTRSWLDINAAKSPSVSYTPGATGDRIRCILTSNQACAAAAQDTSQPLAFTVDTLVIPVTDTVGNVRIYPNPASNVLVFDSLSISDEWETLSITSLNGARNIITQNIAGKISVRVNVSGLMDGMYIAILKRKRGPVIYLKFLKL